MGIKDIFRKFNDSSFNFVADKYNNKHKEIYNTIEQERLEKMIDKILSRFPDKESIKYWISVQGQGILL